jgi:hypothetical protein
METIVPDIGVLSAKAREAERTAAESEKAANLNFMVPSLGPGIELTVRGRNTPGPVQSHRQPQNNHRL